MGMNLASELRKAGWTRVQLAKELSVSERTVYRLITGETPLDPVYEAAIKAALGRSESVAPRPSRRSSTHK